MSDNIIEVKSKNLKVAPNLPYYQLGLSDFSYEKEANKFFSYFADNKINAAFEAVDKHIATPHKDKIALMWEGTEGKKKQYSFFDVYKQSNKFGNYLKKLGVVKGDRVFIFLPRVPYLYFSFLGILKIGAIAGTLFSAFQEQALFDRLNDSEAKILITNIELGERLKNIKDKMINLKKIILIDDEEFLKQLNNESEQLMVEPMNPDDFAFMLYTSGTTGKPKGVVHRHFSILSQHLTAKYVLDLHDEDIYWCTADPGWVTGIDYEILGNWTNAATTIVYEGRFDVEKWYQILQDYHVTVWYTAPTAIRMLMAKGLELIKKYNFSNLRHILSVGEPLNPEAIRWGIQAFGLPFHDTWWQTETGSMILVNFPCLNIKIGSMGKAFLGIKAAIVDDSGNELPNKTEGNIALYPGWPSMMQTIWQNPEKYNSYFINNWYISGDHGWRDDDGYFWFIGRADDVIKTSGERVGPFEVESALIEHPAVVEAGVIGKPDELRGEIVKAFIVVHPEYLEKIRDPALANSLKEEISLFVKKNLAGHAYPKEIEFIDKLPKTRSGKIMRRILKAKEMGQPIGDISTLEEY